MKPKIIGSLLLIVFCGSAQAMWERGEPIAAEGRPNPYQLNAEDFSFARWNGRMHTLVYPVEVTGALLPYRPIQNFLDVPAPNPLRSFMQSISQAFVQVESFADAMRWLGLHQYPLNAGQSGSEFPLPREMKPGDPMGLSLIEKEGTLGFTFSCAACHVGELFGRAVFGLTNRFPRANAFFIKGKMATEAIPSHFFAWATEATEPERRLYKRTRQNMFFVNNRKPLVLGLDTSLSHVALSLARRSPDELATKDPQKPFDPDFEPLAFTPADSKPAVWWNLKYKNRWLLDGSVLSGNPIITNLLWNEIGRGTDLTELEGWLDQNSQKVVELTTAVFSAEAPRFSDFFDVSNFNLEGAKRGQKLYQAACSRCHGQYLKAWDQMDAKQWPRVEQLKTLKVIYPRQTPVIDVGTDPYRREGMKSLERLNSLAISKKNGVIVQEQKGYVPPPLVGIWARWPYLHNNSVPSLCALLMPETARPVEYYSGEPINPSRDFDQTCNGYPVGWATPDHWRVEAHRFDTNKKGLSNRGHNFGRLNEQQRQDVVLFLQTL